MSVRTRLLIVDDDPEVRRSVGRMLGRIYDVELLSDGADAVERVGAGERFELLLMDLEMPRMNGRDAFARIEAIAPALAARALMMSGGSGDPALREWFLALDPRCRIDKPFSREALEGKLLARLVE